MIMTYVGFKLMTELAKTKGPMAKTAICCVKFVADFCVLPEILMLNYQNMITEF